MKGRWLRGLQGDPVPAACSWYFSGVSRTQAQELLLSPPNEPGAFLVRPSESSLGGYSLSVRAQASVCHYRVSMAADGSLYLQKGQLFPGLEELLIYYKANWKLIQNPLLRPCVPQKPIQQDTWERPHSEFALRRKLGEGYFGEVWEGLWLGSLPVAIKIIKSADMKLTDLAKEIQTLKGLRHKRLIRLHAVCSAGEPVYIVTELMGKGNLRAYLGSPEGRALCLSPLLGFACQVAEGMSYLEERRIVHRDLAARNVLVDDGLACKVSDFGLARLLKDDIYSPSSGSKIPVKWTAPEAANYHVFSQKSDVWSFGVLLYEVFTYGQCPYEGASLGSWREEAGSAREPLALDLGRCRLGVEGSGQGQAGMTNHETLQQITRGYRLPRPATCPAEVYVLMLECWRGSPEERPTFAMLWEKLHAIHRGLSRVLT
uniref:tyrosine-protein kinase Srms isoform X1 n=1 Tax=Callithrix jacchus TaxID=9483 RepID=UPI0023DCFA09|nr:tyrosine-protein kinase Srms isoform X1 [Callithrix jacchus]